MLELVLELEVLELVLELEVVMVTKQAPSWSSTTGSKAPYNLQQMRRKSADRWYQGHEGCAR